MRATALSHAARLVHLLLVLLLLLQTIIIKCIPLTTQGVLGNDPEITHVAHSHLRRRQHSGISRQLNANTCSTFATCSGPTGLYVALIDAAAIGQPLKVCASATPISCRTTKNSGPSSIVFASAEAPLSATLECVSDNIGADGGRCIMDLSPGDGLDPTYAAYNAIFLRYVGNSLTVRGFELRGVRGSSRVTHVQRGAEITFRECVFTNNHHKDGNTPVIVQDYGTPASTTIIENSYFSNNVGELLDFQSGTGVLKGNIFYNNKAVPDQKTNFVTNKLVTGTQFVLEDNLFIANDSTGARTSLWLVATEDPTKTMVVSDLLANVSNNCASDNVITGQYATLQILECHNGIFTRGKWTQGYSCTDLAPCSSQYYEAPPLPCEAFLPQSCSAAVGSAHTGDPTTLSPTQSPTIAPTTESPSSVPSTSSSPTGIVIYPQPTQPCSQNECTYQDNFSTCGNNPLEYFIDAGLGNDENTGDSLDTPIQSISRAIEISNANPSSAIVFHLAGGFYGEFGLGPWTNLFTNRASPESWIQYIASTPSDGENPVIFNNLKINFPDLTECRVLLRGIRINGTAPGSSGDNNAIDIKTASHVRIHECIIDPQNLNVWNNYSKTPQGLFTRMASNIIISKSEINGGRYGIVLGAIGRYLQVIDCEIHHQFADAIRVVSVENVLVQGNHMHNVDDYQNTGEHIDGIQFFPSGASGQNYYPQSHNVQIRSNLITDMKGQMIFIQANYIDKIGYMENITVANNILGPMTIIGDAVPVQVQGVKNYLFQSNTVVGKVLIRRESSGTLLGNIIGHLGVTEYASVLSGSDFNVIGEVQVSNGNEDMELGSSIIATTTYADVDALDFAPTTIESCSGGPNGLHAGAVPCMMCEWEPSISGPVANFAVHPSRLDATQYEATLIPSASVICGDADFDTGIWSFSNGGTLTSSNLEESQTLCLSFYGIYSIEFTITDTNGVQSSFSNYVIKEVSAAEGAIAQYPLSVSKLADISPNRHNDATSADPNNSTYTIDRCDFDSFLTLGYDDNIILPNTVRDSINLKPEFTAALWAKPDSPGQLLYKHTSVGIWIEDSTTVHFSVGTNANATHPAWFREDAATANFNSFDGQWHHYAVAFNGTDVLGYIDGSLMASSKVPSNYAMGKVQDGSWDMIMGVRPFKGRNYVGGIKDFRLYDQELEADKIATLVSDIVDCDIFCIESTT